MSPEFALLKLFFFFFFFVFVIIAILDSVTIESSHEMPPGDT